MCRNGREGQGATRLERGVSQHMHHHSSRMMLRLWLKEKNYMQEISLPSVISCESIAKLLVDGAFKES